MKRAIIVCALALGFALSASAESLLAPPSIVVSSPGANAIWALPENAAASDDAYASVSASFVEDPVNQNTNGLKATGFGFAVPASSVIDGLLVEIEKSATLSDANNAVDLSVRLARPDGSLGTENKADSATSWPTADAYASYGGDADLWSEALTPEIVNDPGFGLVISARLHAENTAVTANVDHIRATVYFSEPPPSPPAPEPDPEPEGERKLISSGGGGGGGGGLRSVPPASPAPAGQAVAPPPPGEVLGAETYLFSRLMKYGISSPDVFELQKLLAEEGLFFGPTTGYFGPLTLASVKVFQSKYGLVPDGIVGPLTMAKLNSARVLTFK